MCNRSDWKNHIHKGPDEEKQFAIEHSLDVHEGFSGQYASAMERMRQLNNEWCMYAEAILEKKGLR